MVRVHPICTGAAVQAGIWRAVIDVGLAVGPSESTSTGADEAAERICAGPAVFARVAHTLVDIVVAQLTLPARLACTLIAQVVGRVGADGVIGAGVGGAGGEDVCAGGAGVGRLTDAGEARHAVHAGAFV